jgi:hypothetical protein
MIMNGFFLKPASEELVIPRPDQFNRALSKTGEMCPNNHYYRRRLADGDCVVVEQIIVNGITEEGEVK